MQQNVLVRDTSSLGYTKEAVSPWRTTCVLWSLFTKLMLLDFSYSVSGAGCGLIKGHSFFLLKCEEKVTRILITFMLSHRPQKQKIDSLGSSRDEEAEMYWNSWLLKWKYDNKIVAWTISFVNVWGLTLFLSASHLLEFVYPNIPGAFDKTIYVWQWTAYRIPKFSVILSPPFMYVLWLLKIIGPVGEIKP